MPSYLDVECSGNNLDLGNITLGQRVTAALGITMLRWNRDGVKRIVPTKIMREIVEHARDLDLAVQYERLTEFPPEALSVRWDQCDELPELNPRRTVTLSPQE